MTNQPRFQRFDRAIRGQIAPHDRSADECGDSDNEHGHDLTRQHAGSRKNGWCVMTLTARKYVIIGFAAAILLLAGAFTVVSWLDDLGLIGWARALRDEYLTGSAITIIVVLLVLVGAPAGRWVVRRCPVCERVLMRPARYCPTCGSRI